MYKNNSSVNTWVHWFFLREITWVRPIFLSFPLCFCRVVISDYNLDLFLTQLDFCSVCVMTYIKARKNYEVLLYTQGKTDWKRTDCRHSFMWIQTIDSGLRITYNVYISKQRWWKEFAETTGYSAVYSRTSLQLLKINLERIITCNTFNSITLSSRLKALEQ